MITQRRRRRYVAIIGAFIACAGCMGPLFRPQSPQPIDEASGDSVESNVQLVGDLTHPYGLGFMKVESVALVTGLGTTGEDPPPSSQRAALLAEMNRREIEDPNEVLASPDTALVVVRGILRPGIQEGEPFDIEVRTPGRSETTSLRGGYLLQTSLTETAVLGNSIRTGHIMAYAAGPILVDPSAEVDEDPALTTRGRVLSGGVARKSRDLGLMLDHEHQSVPLSQLVGKAINHRFHTYIGGARTGVASPKTDEFIEIHLHPRYADNIGRYMRVIGSIAVRESSLHKQERLSLLTSQLLDPVTASTAALRLEAIGRDEAVSILKQGAQSTDPEVRFYAAEALAYLDDTAAVDPLAQAAVEEPAFRINALAALATMEDGSASEALQGMLSAKSAETRYGAFRSLWSMDSGDPLVQGEKLGGKFFYHVLDVEGPPMIHATSSHRPEIVLFGKNHQLKLPLVLDAGKRIMINGLSGGEITVSRFAPGEETQQRVISTDVDQLIRTIVELGGQYPDVVQMLQQAKTAGALPSRFRVNALPEPGREVERDAPESNPEFDL